MAKKGRAGKSQSDEARATVAAALAPPTGRPSSLLDTRVIYCGDCLEQLRKLPERCVDLIYIDPWCEEIEQSFNSNRNSEVFWSETKEKRKMRDEEHLQKA